MKSGGASPPLTPPQGAGKSSPPDGLGGQANFACPEPYSVEVNLTASRVRKPGFARP